MENVLSPLPNIDVRTKRMESSRKHAQMNNQTNFRSMLCSHRPRIHWRLDIESLLAICGDSMSAIQRRFRLLFIVAVQWWYFGLGHLGFSLRSLWKESIWFEVDCCCRRRFFSVVLFVLICVVHTVLLASSGLVYLFVFVPYLWCKYWFSKAMTQRACHSIDEVFENICRCAYGLFEFDGISDCAWHTRPADDRRDRDGEQLK